MNNEELQQKNKHFIKQLAPNYKLMHYGYRLIISEIWSEPIVPVYEGSLKTIKFESMPEIYIVTPANKLELIWICDRDGTGWNDYQFFVKTGIIAPFEELAISLWAGYEVLAGVIKSDIMSIPIKRDFGWITKLIKAIFGK